MGGDEHVGGEEKFDDTKKPTTNLDEEYQVCCHCI
jgi:hypothetical protein